MTRSADELALEMGNLAAGGVGPAEFTRRLLERGELARVRGPLRRVKTKSAPRIAFMKDAIVRGALRWLVRSGGWRVRQVVTGKRRREGRIWAANIWEALSVRYSPATLELVAAAAGWCQRDATAHRKPPAGPRPSTLEEIANRSSDPELELPGPRALAGLVPATLGDLVVFHLAIDALLDACPIPPDDVRPAAAPAPKPVEPPPPPAPSRPRSPTGGAATPAPASPPTPSVPVRVGMRPAHLEKRRSLLALSSLTALYRADELLQGEKTGTNEGWAVGLAKAEKIFTPLVAGDRAALLTYLDDAVAVRWIEHEVARRALHATEAGDRYVDLACALEGFMAAASRAARPDALRPVLRFFERYLVKFGQREAVAAAFKSHAQSLVRASERARFLGQVARLFAVTRLVAAESERILATPFVDRTEEEKVFVADVSDFTRSVQPELEAIRRELAGEVG